MPDEKKTEEKQEPVIKPNTDSYLAQQSKKSAVKQQAQPVKVHKKHAAAERVREEIISEGASTVKEYLVWDVLIPAIKRTLADLGHEAVNIIFGKATGSYRGGRDDNRTYIQYDRPSYQRDRTYRPDYARRDRDDHRYNPKHRHRFDDYVIEDKHMAEDVFDELVESTMRYGVATVKDFYKALRLPTNYMDEAWGWYDLSQGHVQKVHGGYILVLPKPVYIEDD